MEHNFDGFSQLLNTPLGQWYPVAECPRILCRQSYFRVAVALDPLRGSTSVASPCVRGMTSSTKVDQCFASLRRLHTVADKVGSHSRLGVAALQSGELVKAAFSVANSWRICYYDQLPSSTDLSEMETG